MNDPHAAHKTTAILGQPVEVGKPGGWQAALCFSTDRALDAYPDYRFSIKADAGLLSLFASLVSSILTLAGNTEDKDGKPLLERIWMKYSPTVKGWTMADATEVTIVPTRVPDRTSEKAPDAAMGLGLALAMEEGDGKTSLDLAEGMVRSARAQIRRDALLTVLLRKAATLRATVLK